MFELAVVLPSAPILVPELCGARCADDVVTPLRNAVLHAGRELAGVARGWTAVTVGPADAEISPGAVGSFRGFGADVTVALSATGGDEKELPLGILLAGWLREQISSEIEVRGHVIAQTASLAECVRLGERLRRIARDDARPRGVLVVADGANSLSTAAPGYFHPRARDQQELLDMALRTGDCAGLSGLEAAGCREVGMTGRAAFQVLAAVFDNEKLRVASRYCQAPFGVGYHVATWRPSTFAGGRP